MGLQADGNGERVRERADRCNATQKLHVSSQRGKTVAVDMSHALYQFKACDPPAAAGYVAESVFEMGEFGVRVIAVLDSAQSSFDKEARQRQYTTGKRLRPDWIRAAGDACRALLEAHGVEVVIAPEGYQADNVIAYLAEAGKIGAISSTDGDMLVFGLPVWWQHNHTSGKFLEIDPTKIDFLSDLDTKERAVRCACFGNDYSSGVCGVTMDMLADLVDLRGDEFLSALFRKLPKIRGGRDNQRRQVEMAAAMLCRAVPPFEPLSRSERGIPLILQMDEQRADDVMKAVDIVEKPLPAFDEIYSRAKSAGFEGNMSELHGFLVIRLAGQGDERTHPWLVTPGRASHPAGHNNDPLHKQPKKQKRQQYTEVSAWEDSEVEALFLGRDLVKGGGDVEVPHWKLEVLLQVINPVRTISSAVHRLRLGRDAPLTQWWGSEEIASLRAHIEGLTGTPGSIAEEVWSVYAADGGRRTKYALKAKIRNLEKERKSVEDLGAAGLTQSHQPLWEPWEDDIIRDEAGKGGTKVEQAKRAAKRINSQTPTARNRRTEEACRLRARGI